MKLTRNQKYVVGASTLWMLAYPLLFVVMWFAMVASMFVAINARNEPPFAFFGLFMCIMPFHFLTIGISLALMAFYWAHIIKNVTTSDTLRIIFGIGIFMFGYIAMPIYFYFFVWRDETPAWARPSAPPSAAPPNVIPPPAS
ncbi:MAG: hypothetical protein L0Y55_16415 [Anaerolineales bacterium]|nr:hypothetical protein [Anaerolineales bacterium]